LDTKSTVVGSRWWSLCGLRDKVEWREWAKRDYLGFSRKM